MSRLGVRFSPLAPERCGYDEMVDLMRLERIAARRGGSSPSTRTKI